MLPPAVADDRRRWLDQAACQGMPASMFFTPAEVRDDSRPERERMARAKQVCAACPVVIQCATHALREPELYGVWGGLTPKERERLRRRPASGTA